MKNELLRADDWNRALAQNVRIDNSGTFSVEALAADRYQFQVTSSNDGQSTDLQSSYLALRTAEGITLMVYDGAGPSIAVARMEVHKLYQRLNESLLHQIYKASAAKLKKLNCHR